MNLGLFTLDLTPQLSPAGICDADRPEWAAPQPDDHRKCRAHKTASL